MFTELNIIYPNKSCNEKILDLLQKEKEKFMRFKNCIDYSIHKDSYSDKIIYIIKWDSKDDMQNSNYDNDYKTNLKEKMLLLQKFPSEVYYLKEILQ